MRKGLHIGTSGWSYLEDKTGWLNVFYNSREGLLKQYLTCFDTAEINSTFYAQPKPNFIRYLAKGVAEEKFFTAKLPKKITHDHRLNLKGEGGEVLNEFLSLMEPLKGRLASMLIQLPPWEISKMGNLEDFLSVLSSTSFRYAIEFRDESWLTASVMSLLEDYKIAYVIVDEPKLPIDIRVTTDFTYVRWHGHGSRPWYNYRYSENELKEWKPRLKELADKSDVVLGYFNNHFSGNAPINALQMLKFMEMITPQQTMKLERMLDQTATKQASLDEF